MFIVPRIYFTLHPDPILNTRGKLDMDPRIRWVFFGMLLGFTGLFFWLQSLKTRMLRVARRIEERGVQRVASGEGGAS
jgi:heme exporter protein C